MPQRKVFFFYDMSEVYDLRRMLEEKAQFLDLIGKSKPMHRVYEGIQEVAAVDVTVSIEGETGTGKELVAKAIHSSSHRKDKPFIAVNCAGFTDSLLTSQLFGHKRGAFTGAHEDNKGVFEAANGGTLFLDEIGEIPMNVQINLLRVLQEREVTRVGESTTRKVDVRVITATNRDLVKEVEKGTFRADLFFRIRVARVQVPPLRERREDIPLLVGAFIKKNNAASGKQVENVSNKAMNKLLEYDWPGNVRELVNTIEFANLRCKGSTINLQDLPPEITEHFSETQTPAISMTHGLSEKDRFVTALEEASGNRKEAAQLLNMSRATFYRRLSKLGIANK
jgi:transcriptional regulator with PAS, ATPase and Fis domain